MYNRVPIGLLIELDPSKGYSKLLSALKRHDGNVSKVAKSIGVSRSTVKRWIARLERSGYKIRSEIDRLRSL